MKKFNQIIEFGKRLMSSKNIQNSLELIAKESRMLSNAQRCSIFMVDKEDEILWTMISDGIGRIVISLDSGIVGKTYNSQKAQIVNDPYNHPDFLKDIDKKSGFTTRNIITIPIFNSLRDVIGIIQLLNKEGGDFNDKDLETLTFFANYISGSLELILINEN